MDVYVHLTYESSKASQQLYTLSAFLFASSRNASQGLAKLQVFASHLPGLKLERTVINLSS